MGLVRGGRMREQEAWLALNMVPHVGPAAFALLLERFERELLDDAALPVAAVFSHGRILFPQNHNAVDLVDRDGDEPRAATWAAQARPRRRIV